MEKYVAKYAFVENGIRTKPETLGVFKSDVEAGNAISDFVTEILHEYHSEEISQDLKDGSVTDDKDNLREFIWEYYHDDHFVCNNDDESGPWDFDHPWCEYSFKANDENPKPFNLRCWIEF